MEDECGDGAMGRDLGAGYSSGAAKAKLVGEESALGGAGSRHNIRYMDWSLII